MAKKLFSTVTLSNGDKLIVDREDAERVREKKWHSFKVDKKIYARSGRVYLQKFILGDKANDALIRFKNNNSLDCRKDNLTILKRISKESISVIANKSGTKQVTKFEKKLKNAQENNTTNKLKKQIDLKTKIEQEIKDNKIFGVYPKLVFESKLITDDRDYNFGTYPDLESAIKAYNENVLKLKTFLPVEPPVNSI